MVLHKGKSLYGIVKYFVSKICWDFRLFAYQMDCTVGGVKTPSRTSPPPDLSRGGGPKDVVRNVVMVKLQRIGIGLIGLVILLVKELKEVSRLPPGPPPPTSPEGGGGGVTDCWNVGKLFAGSNYKLTQPTCRERTHFSRQIGVRAGCLG
jgi:hypothetical protein